MENNNVHEENTTWDGVNRRKHIRAKADIRFCAFRVIDFGEEDQKLDVENCIKLKSFNMSEGGFALAHKNTLKVGEIIEIRGKSSLSFPHCRNCKAVFMLNNDYELVPMLAEVIWATERRAGVSFIDLHGRNRNIISKIVWEQHIKEVRKDRED